MDTNAERTGNKSQTDAATSPERLLALFAGNHRNHGEFYPDNRKPGAGEKVERTKAKTDAPGPTVELWQRHLKGEFILGVIPIMDDDTCW